MKSLSLLGILLVVLGALALAYQGINYTHREKIVDLGPIHATQDSRSTYRSLRFSEASPCWAEWPCWSLAPGKKFNGSFRLGSGS